MIITLEEVIGQARNWFEAVHSGATGLEVARFDLYPNVRIYTPEGSGLDLDYHQRMHTKWRDEVYAFGNFYIPLLSSAPERARADSTVYREACYRDAKT